MNHGNHGNPATVLIPLGPLGVLELPEAVYRQYLRATPPTMWNPATTTPNAAQTPPELVDGKTIASTFNIPTSWIMERARAGLLPCVMVGRYRRFEIAAVRAALASTGAQPEGRGAQPIDSKGPNSARARNATGGATKVGAGYG